MEIKRTSNILTKEIRQIHEARLVRINKLVRQSYISKYLFAIDDNVTSKSTINNSNKVKK